jgi:hypothetical protein
VETDSIRSSGTNTLVDLWIDGKVRAICVTQDAIGAYLSFDRTASMSEQDRCEFVRGHLPLLVSAAKSLLKGDPATESVTIGLGQLPRADGRSGDRRKAERRKATKPREGTERRRRDRRQGTSPKPE